VVRRSLFLGLSMALLSSGAFAQGVGLPNPAAPASTVPGGPGAGYKPPEEVIRGDTVAGRARPDYDAIGVRVGGFMFYPDLQVQESYNSNIFYTNTNKTRDYITNINPNLDLRSNWNQHALNFHADANIARYAHTSSENYEDYTVGADGRVDIYHDARGYGGAAYRVRHEPRYSPDNIFGASTPTQYDDVALNLAGEKEFNRLSFRLDGNYDKFSYNDVRTNAGTLIRQSLRDHDEKQLALRTGYEIAPLRQVYLLTALNWRTYDSNSDLFGFNRSSNGYTLGVGARYDVTGVVFLDAYVGYRRQEYDDARLSTASGAAGGAQLTWNVTRLTTIYGGLTRDVNETVIAGASSYFATRLTLGADHEVLRNLILSANVGYERDDFQGLSRTDNLWSAGTGARYLLNRNFWLSGGYQYFNRSSDAAVNFDDHVLFARVSAHL